ncbi:MOSC domain-containing protein [Massilia sp. S19_KUP03_FR1]|uniref:MOSC domain-containing protein n=1 Tax=Massilia sp. S19_KUP03_FR1 TaxID=3025503 RepID=UPI002FCD12DC
MRPACCGTDRECRLKHGSEQGGEQRGHVAGLFLRRQAGAAPETVTQVLAIAGQGLEGDSQRHALSPRQLLLAGTRAYARLALPVNALRENVLLDIDSAGLASGQLLAAGAGAVFQLTFACEPCGRLNLRQDRLSGSIGAQRGMLARVLRGGPVALGDPVRLLPYTLPSWPDDWRARVAAVLARVPSGSVVEYRQLALLAGVALTYCRVFPRLARALGLAHKAVPLRSACALPRWDGADLYDAPSA